ncbi:MULTISPECIES: acyltransferase family protein [Methylomonas]|uniref:Acyltransferase n=1 Tax=Methylomonas koyamae TaxID=702114 RepID=A0A177P857_9GAMM|nr:acyltransferase family protein [Methylomonas koyamae]OAI26371.1 hypothetical protein A1355_18945 [Methylomonas koyamae]
MNITKYRGDIDGLRAIAVVSVILFHYNFGKYFSGGYVGVDIFFVISGYLITSIIYNDILQNNYSILDFYHRRIRRIFPALFFVFFCCILASFFLQFPSESEYTGKSIVSSIFFVSNIFFSDLNGYFDHKMESNPVLHTWSLSVEEQYYVFFPPLIYLIRNLSLSIQKNIILITLISSLVYSEHAIKINSVNAFYLVQSRAWELLIGASLGIGAWPRIQNKWQIEGLSLLGLTALVFSISTYSKETAFPGISALPPCLGTALIIYTGSLRETVVRKTLSFKIFRLIGIISYSLYLWHWPVLVFVKQIHEPQSYLQNLLLIIVCLALSAISWKYVEQPFRKSPYKLKANPTLALALVTMLIFSTASLFLSSVSEKYYNYPQRVFDVLTVLDYDADTDTRAGKCFLTSNYNSFDKYNIDECLAVSSNKKNVLLIGDSHAAHLWPGLNSTFPEVNFLQASASGCKPVLNSTGEKRCTDLITFIFTEYLSKQHFFDTIIISGRWQKQDISAAITTADWLTKFANQVIISGPINEYYQPLPRILAKALANNENESEYLNKYRNTSPREVDNEFLRALLPRGVSYLSVYKIMSEPTWKVWASDQMPMQFDYGHLTKLGSELLIKSSKLDELF